MTINLALFNRVVCFTFTASYLGQANQKDQAKEQAKETKEVMPIVFIYTDLCLDAGILGVSLIHVCDIRVENFEWL